MILSGSERPALHFSCRVLIHHQGRQAEALRLAWALSWRFFWKISLPDLLPCFGPGPFLTMTCSSMCLCKASVSAPLRVFRCPWQSFCTCGTTEQASCSLAASRLSLDLGTVSSCSVDTIVPIWGGCETPDLPSLVHACKYPGAGRPLRLLLSRMLGQVPPVLGHACGGCRPNGRAVTAWRCVRWVRKITPVGVL